MLVTRIKIDIRNAMFNKEKEKLSTLRLLLAKLEKEKISFKLNDVSELNDEQVESVVLGNIKELNKEIESYVSVGRTTEKQEDEKVLLMSYLPEQMTEEEILIEITKAINIEKGVGGGLGFVMKHLSNELKGVADMKLVGQFVKQEFAKKK